MTMSAESPAAASGSQLKVPDFFIVGHPKSGTTALYEMLRRHPQIYMPENKEPMFFASDFTQLRFRSPMSGPPLESLDAYLSLFSDAEPGQLVGEASSPYLWSRVAAERIAHVQPAARIIAILREPASFLRSQHLQLVQNHVEWEKDLRKAISLEGARRQGRRIPRRSHRPQLLLYSEHVRYVEQLRRYHAAFPSEQVLVLIYDDFRSDNEATVRTVLRFLGVDDAYQIEVLQANPTVLIRSQHLDRMVHAVTVGRGPASRAVHATVKALMPRRLRHDALALTQRRVVEGSPPPPDEPFMLELRRRFKGEVQALSEYLDRDLVSLWGYDRLG